MLCGLHHTPVGAQVCIERCLSRGAAGSGRADDNMQSLEKRLDTYNSSTMPIIDHYAEKSLVKQFDASRSVDDVSSYGVGGFKTTLRYGIDCSD